MNDELPIEDDFPVRVYFEWLEDEKIPHNYAAQCRANRLKVGEAEVYVCYHRLTGPAHRFYVWRPYHNMTYVEQIG